MLVAADFLGIPLASVTSWISMKFGVYSYSFMPIRPCRELFSGTLIQKVIVPSLSIFFEVFGYLGKLLCLYCSFTSMTEEKMQSRSGITNSLSNSGSFLDHGCKQAQSDLRVVHGDRTLEERFPPKGLCASSSLLNPVY